MYKILPQLPFELENLSCDSLDPDDIESVRVWRNDQIDVLRQTRHISRQEQIEYFQRYVWPDLDSDQPSQILFKLTELGRMIGYAGLVHIDWPSKRAEISFLLEPKRNEPRALLVSYFLKWLKMAQHLAFANLGLNLLTTETYATRPEIIRALEQSSFKREGTLPSHVNLGGNLIDSVLHSRLRAEWENSSGDG